MADKKESIKWSIMFVLIAILVVGMFTIQKKGDIILAKPSTNNQIVVNDKTWTFVRLDSIEEVESYLNNLYRYQANEAKVVYNNNSKLFYIIHPVRNN